MDTAHAWVDHIPVIWIEPATQRPTRRLALFLNHLGGTKEGTTPYLQDLAAQGFVALSFDAWQHGERGTEPTEALMKRVFGNFRRHMWPILGQTTLDTLRIIDWAIASLNVAPEVYAAGVSMGGDIVVAAAGVDPRIKRVAAVVATPDWLRPGMHDVFQPGTLLPAGEPDRYAEYFYERLNALTNLAAYAHVPAIHFVCGEQDTHVPPDGALRFQAAWRNAYPAAADQVTVTLIPGMSHLGIRDRSRWWPDSCAWLTR